MSDTVKTTVEHWGSEARSKWTLDDRQSLASHLEWVDRRLEPAGVDTSRLVEARAFLLGAVCAMKTVAQAFDSAGDLEFWRRSEDEVEAGSHYDRELMISDVSELPEFQAAMSLVIGDAAVRFESADLVCGTMAYLFQQGEEQ